jgi:hypothetical protein
MAVDKDMVELKNLIKRAAGMDTAPPTTTASRIVKGKRQKGPVSGFFKHPSQPSLDSSVVFDSVKEAVQSRVDSQEQEQDALDASEVNDPESYDDALSSDEVEQIAAALVAPESTTRNAAGARETGLEAANREYAARRGARIARVS